MRFMGYSRTVSGARIRMKLKIRSETFLKPDSSGMKSCWLS